MARIRTIKPEFWAHEDLSLLSESTHILAAALLNHADDEGYFSANPGLVKAACSPLREPSVSIHDSLTSLSNAGFLRLGTSDDGKQYGHIVKFLEHQVINRPTPSKIKKIPIEWDNSLKTHGVLTEDSSGKGKEQGKERKGEEERASAPEKEYVFEGEVFNLTAKSLAQWQASFHLVSDMLAEVRLADAYYAAEGETDKKKLFFKISQWLKRIHDGELAKRAKDREGEERMRRLMLKSTPEEDREFYRQGILEDIARQKRLAQEAEEIGNDGTPFLRFAAELERSLH